MKLYNPKTLPYIGATVQAGLFAVAGYKYFNVGPWGAVAGFGMGALVNLSMATASSRISDIAKARRPLAWASLLGLFAISPAVIVSSLGWSWANLFWSIGADLSIILTGAIIGKGLTSEGQATTEAPASAGKLPKVATKTKGKQKQAAAKQLTDENLLAELASNPAASHRQLAVIFGVSHQAIGQRLANLKVPAERKQ
jgi:hypothetical protein